MDTVVKDESDLKTSGAGREEEQLFLWATLVSLVTLTGHFGFIINGEKCSV